MTAEIAAVHDRRNTAPEFPMYECPHHHVNRGGGSRWICPPDGKEENIPTYAKRTSWFLITIGFHEWNDPSFSHKKIYSCTITLHNQAQLPKVTPSSLHSAPSPTTWDAKPCQASWLSGTAMFSETQQFMVRDPTFSFRLSEAS
jgi:hypothetical protein